MKAGLQAAVDRANEARQRVRDDCWKIVEGLAWAWELTGAKGDFGALLGLPAEAAQERIQRELHGKRLPLQSGFVRAFRGATAALHPGLSLDRLRHHHREAGRGVDRLMGVLEIYVPEQQKRSARSARMNAGRHRKHHEYDEVLEKWFLEWRPAHPEMTIVQATDEAERIVHLEWEVIRRKLLKLNKTLR